MGDSPDLIQKPFPSETRILSYESDEVVSDVHEFPLPSRSIVPSSISESYLFFSFLRGSQRLVDEPLVQGQGSLLCPF